MKTKVLIVEDEADLATITGIHLQKAGYETNWAATCQEALYQLSKESYDLIVLDEMLPDGRGCEVCAKIQELSSEEDGCPPVLFTSCELDRCTVIKALGSGGDDYMTKPIHYPEFLARVEALLRRSHRKTRGVESHVQAFRTFSLDTTKRQLLRHGDVVDLSPIEYQMLRYLIDHPDTLVLYATLYQNVWDSDSLGDNRTVMVHISNLRKKIDPDGTGVITTVRNAGYIFSNQ